MSIKICPVFLAFLLSSTTKILLCDNENLIHSHDRQKFQRQSLDQPSPHPQRKKMAAKISTNILQISATSLSAYKF